MDDGAIVIYFDTDVTIHPGALQEHGLAHILSDHNTLRGDEPAHVFIADTWPGMECVNSGFVAVRNTPVTSPFTIVLVWGTYCLPLECCWLLRPHLGFQTHLKWIISSEDVDFLNREYLMSRWCWNRMLPQKRPTLDQNNPTAGDTKRMVLRRTWGRVCPPAQQRKPIGSRDANPAYAILGVGFDTQIGSCLPDWGGS